MAKTLPLSAKAVSMAKPKEKIYKLSDGGGLQLRIRPNGNKSWLLDYVKPQTKKRSSIGLGGYPDISLASARVLRDKFRELVAQGIDPKDYKAEQLKLRLSESENTFEVVAKNWFEVKKSKVSDNYADDVWRSIEIYMLPKLGNVQISNINAPDTIAILKPIEASGKLETLKRVIQRTNEVMDFGVNTGLIHANPLAKINVAFKKPKKSNFPSIAPKDLPEFLDALHNANMKIATRHLIMWQLHTMSRPGEAARAEWSEIDFDKNIWKIPAHKMKKQKEHLVPLTPQTLKLLKRMQPISGDRKFIFPGDRKPNSHMNEQTANDVIKRIGYEGKLVAHGLRAIASTALNEHGFEPDLIEKALAHEEKNEVRKAYNRAKYLSKRQDMMNWWSEEIEKAQYEVN